MASASGLLGPLGQRTALGDTCGPPAAQQAHHHCRALHVVCSVAPNASAGVAHRVLLPKPVHAVHLLKNSLGFHTATHVPPARHPDS